MVKIRNVLFLACFVFPLLSVFPSIEKNLEDPPEEIDYKVTKTFPHPYGSFTQGFVFEDGFLYEGTGQYGTSSLRKINLESGEIIKEIRLPRNLFGEGITIQKDRIIQLTWLSETGFVYDKKSFRLLDTFRYPVSIEGWGLTTDGRDLIMSDGSDVLYFLDPETFQVKKRLSVRDHQGPVWKINELEYVEGALYANVWQSNDIIKIDLNSGSVTGIIDLANIVPKQFRGHNDYVLNGIAYDRARKKFLVTGKMWPTIFELELFIPE